MSIRKYIETRIDVDYYTIAEYELTENRNSYTWEFVSSIGDRFPSKHLCDQARRKAPFTSMRNNGDTRTFYACVYYFPQPRLAGKWKDYTTAYGWDNY